MAGNWTPEQAASLAPDAASLKAAQGLASSRKWTLLGGDGEFIWGWRKDRERIPTSRKSICENRLLHCVVPLDLWEHLSLPVCGEVLPLRMTFDFGEARLVLKVRAAAHLESYS